MSTIIPPPWSGCEDVVDGVVFGLSRAVMFVPRLNSRTLTTKVTVSANPPVLLRVPLNPTDVSNRVGVGVKVIVTRTKSQTIQDPSNLTEGTVQKSAQIDARVGADDGEGSTLE